MKVGDKDGIKDSVRISGLQEQQSEANRTAKKRAEQDLTSQTGQDTVSVGLSQSIRDSIDVTEMIQARAARFEELKRQVNAGEYKMPPSEEIAAKLVEEIGLEISTNRGRASNE